MVGFRSASVLQDLLPLLKAHCGQAEYDEYLKAVAAVSFEITTEIFNRVFLQFPDLKEEVDKKIEQYGKFI